MEDSKMARTTVPKADSTLPAAAGSTLTLESRPAESDVLAEMEERSERALRWRSTSAGELDRDSD